MSANSALEHLYDFETGRRTTRIKMRVVVASATLCIELDSLLGMLEVRARRGIKDQRCGLACSIGVRFRCNLLFHLES